MIVKKTQRITSAEIIFLVIIIVVNLVKHFSLRLGIWSANSADAYLNICLFSSSLQVSGDILKKALRELLEWWDVHVVVELVKEVR